MADTTTENGASEAAVVMETENTPVAKNGEEVTSSDGAGEVSQLEAKIIKQVEYYFGDMNLIKDKFLQEQIKEDDGWVSMETMIKFKRLADLSTDFAVILNALKKSTTGLMEVGDNKIRRCPDKKLPETFDALKSATKNQTVYCKGFPGDATLDDIMEFMEQFGKTDNIVMRRDKDKKFKGSVFVTYATEESAKKFVAAESLKFKDQEEEVIKFSKEGYYQHKADEKRALKEKNVKDKEVKMLKKEEEEEEAFKKRVQYGAILLLSNLPEDVKREVIREKFEAFAPVQWIDIEKTEAKVRFSEAGGAKKAWEAATAEAGEGAKVKVADTEVEGRILEGEEELNHWRDVVQQQKASKFGKRRGGGSGRGGRGGGGGRGGHNRKRSAQGQGGGDAPAAKQAKVE